MPTYINRLSTPVYFNDVVYVPNQPVESFDSMENQAFIVGTVDETFAIVGGVNDALLIRFNDEDVWTTVTLTAGGAQTAADVIADINTAYGATVAYAEGTRVRIQSPIRSNILSTVYIATAVTGSTAAVTLGFVTDDVNPVSSIFFEASVISTNAETYNITAANNTFIFKPNNWPSWISATLTVGATQSAADIASDINSAYETATADATPVAAAVTPVAGGAVYVKLLAPIYNNFQSKLYIKTTGNTALATLGFTGDDFDPIAESSYPFLVRTNVAPFYNPIIAETAVVFAGAGTQYLYLTDPDAARELQFIRVGGPAGITFSCYLEDLTNLPPFTIVANETFGINLWKYRISRVVITANMAGNLTVRELKG